MGVDELRTVDRAIDAFLAEEIAIPVTTRTNASSSQNYLRQVLRNKANADASFPELLSKNDSDFLGGSFARHTKIWPLDDIDLFLPLEAGGLSYVNNGIRLPFTIVSDGNASRLLQDRWLTNTYVDSTKVLNGLRAGLRDTYPSSIVKLDNHCVNLQTTVAATTESDGIGFDVVPCFRLVPHNGSEFFYLVPDGVGGWMRSNPRKDTELCAELQAFHGTYRQAVRLVKYWNKTQLDDAFQSYYIELAMSRKFLALKQQNQQYGFLTHAFGTAMTQLKAAYYSGDLTSLILEAPPVNAPLLTERQTAVLETDVQSANSVFQQAYHNSRTAEAFGFLNAIFGTEFFG